MGSGCVCDSIGEKPNMPHQTSSIVQNIDKKFDKIIRINTHKNTYDKKKNDDQFEENAKKSTISKDNSNICQIEDKIGKGQHADINKINIRKKYYVVKEYKPNCKTIMKTESEILDKLKHKNIVNYYDNLTKEGYKKGINNHIIIELCVKENIQDYINKEKSKINPKFIYTIIKDICLGLKEIHSKNIIHCDLKPSNILIGHDYKVKICDLEYLQY